MPRVLILTVDPGPPTLVNDVQIVFSGPIVEDAESAATPTDPESWPLRTGMRFLSKTGMPPNSKPAPTHHTQLPQRPGGRFSADIDTKEHLGRLVITLDSGPRYRLGNSSSPVCSGMTLNS
jgi:translocation and assembly module TamA